MGQGLSGRATQSLNLKQFGHRMELENFACIYVHPCVCGYVCPYVCMYVCVRACKNVPGLVNQVCKTVSSSNLLSLQENLCLESLGLAFPVASNDFTLHSTLLGDTYTSLAVAPTDLFCRWHCETVCHAGVHSAFSVSFTASHRCIMAR